MNLEKDFVCDYALKLFTERQTCSEIYFPIAQVSTSKNKDVLTRQLLFNIVFSVTRAQPASVRVTRMIFEELPGLIKSLEAFTEDDDLQLFINRYYEKVVDMLQLVALESQRERTSLSESLRVLKLTTSSLVTKFRERLKPPFLLKVFQDYQRRLEERLDKKDQNSAIDSSPPENEVSMETVEPSVQSEKQTVTESVASNSSLQVSDHSKCNEATEKKAVCDLSSVEIGAFDSDDVQDCLIESDTITFSERTCDNESCKTTTTSAGHSQSNQPLEKYSKPTNRHSTHTENSHKSLRDQSPDTKHSEGELDEAVASSGFDTKSNSNKARQRRPFSVESDAMLIQGIKRYGTADWKAIHENYSFPSYRKPAHLKDRWRTLLSKGTVSVDGEEVSITAKEQAKAYKAYLKKQPFIGDPPVPTIKLRRPRLSPEKETNMNPSLSRQSFHGSSHETSSTRKEQRKRRLWEVEGEAMTWDSPSSDPHRTSTSLDKTIGRKHRKKPWNDWEIENLIKGMRRFGIGQWASILSHYRFSSRNSVMLKDKYRNMLRKQELPKDLLHGVHKASA